MYNLELGKIAKQIKLDKPKKVLIQLPDGLKPHAEQIVNFLEGKTSADILIWFGNCYGACDLPPITSLGIDLTIQFGHSKFNKTSSWEK
ncbi:MAG: diphthamide synthesis protein [Nanoarchaeota archaeon]|nr:diphthamide synthesis protein [Nanoarchaeota archaeon]